MVLPSIIFATCSAVVVLLVRSFLKDLGREVADAWDKSRHEMNELQKSFNVQVRELAENFTSQTIELQTKHLEHLKDLEMKMLAGGVKEYVDAQDLYGGTPNFHSEKENGVDDWVDLAPQPFAPPAGVKFGVEDTEGNVKVMGEKKKKGKK